MHAHLDTHTLTHIQTLINIHRPKHTKTHSQLKTLYYSHPRTFKPIYIDIYTHKCIDLHIYWKRCNQKQACINKYEVNSKIKKTAELHFKTKQSIEVNTQNNKQK